MMIERFEISAVDRTSPLWRDFSAHMEQRIALLRAQNDADKDPIQTANLRGRIAELKAISALGEPRPFEDWDIQN